MPIIIRPKTDDFYVLKLSPIAQAKTYFASMSGGVLTAIPVKIIAPILFVPASELIAIGAAFVAAAYPISCLMERRAMHSGQWRIQKMKKPKIEIH